MSIRCVLFDLDGTLVDTAPDLVGSLNHLLVQNNKDPIAYEIARPFASAGSRGLLKLGFDLDEGDSDYAPLRQRFIEHYAENSCLHSRLFDGIPALLSDLNTQGIRWGVVTNKPGFLTEPLMQALDFPSAPACVIGGDATANLKPHPDNLLLACEQIQHLPQDCLYVGDAQRDITAGQRAGMRTVAVSYGYIRPYESPEQWGADFLIHHPQELLACLSS
ncbi:MAG: HAD family hydrolase [Nevskiales bacterium]